MSGRRKALKGRIGKAATALFGMERRGGDGMSRLALLGGKPLREKPFPRWPVFGEEEERALIEVLLSGKLGALDV